jgi:guanyl-specific ribonuclease Sa
VQSGIYSPNEARASEDLDAVAFGDEPRTQAQVVPLSAAGSIQSAPTSAVPTSAPAARNYKAAVQLDIEALRAHSVPNASRRLTEQRSRASLGKPA